MRRCALLLLAAACHEDVAVVATQQPAPSPRADACAADIELGPGLTHERHAIGTTSATGATACLDVVRADLAQYRLRVLTSRDATGSHPAPWWRDTFHLTAVTNAGMFHEGGGPVGLIVEDGTTIGRDNKTFSGYLAFDTASATIAGRDCVDFDLTQVQARFDSLVQSARLLGCSGQPLPWKDTKQYSAAAIGIDRKNHVVFMHARDAVTMTELAEAVGKLDLAGALFLEGGPEASLVVRGTKGELARMGSYETGFVENDANQQFWYLPNVIALERR